MSGVSVTTSDRTRGSSTAPTALERAPAGTPLYVHLPFCAAKCPYCDFYSVTGEGHDIGALVSDILSEAEARAPEAPRTVFFGGGTPSYLSPAELRQLLDGLEQQTGFRSSAREVTAECNPESLDEEKAAAFLELGVRRLSIGFQSLDAATLELFGRVHDVEQSFAAFRAARRAGIEHLSVDLIYGAPGQTPAACREELLAVLDLAPDHVSAYNLTYEEGTPFEAWKRQGRLEQASEELELELFWTVRETLAGAGFEAYEISNYARPGERCHHNVNYWHNGPYVGIGPSAVSLVGRRRSGNPRSLPAWRAGLRHGVPATPPTGHGSQDAPGWSEELGDWARLGETWWLGLRLTDGLTPREAHSRAGLGPARDPSQDPSQDPSPDPAAQRDPAGLLAATLHSQGLLVAEPAPSGDPDHTRYRLSRRGLPLADAVAREFLDLQARTAS